MLIKSVGQIKADYVRACNNLFIHTGSDSTLNERREYEQKYNLALKNLSEYSLIPDDIGNPKKCRICEHNCSFGTPNCISKLEHNECN